jgi:hypothetical protein
MNLDTYSLWKSDATSGSAPSCGGLGPVTEAKQGQAGMEICRQGHSGTGFFPATDLRWPLWVDPTSPSIIRGPVFPHSKGLY